MSDAERRRCALPPDPAYGRTAPVLPPVTELASRAGRPWGPAADETTAGPASMEAP